MVSKNSNPQPIRLTENAPDLSTWIPDTPTEFAQRGWILYLLKDYDKAESDLRKAVSADNTNPEYLYPLGLIMKAQGMNEEANQLFRKTIEHLERIEHFERAEMLSRLCHYQMHGIVMNQQ